MATQIQRTQSAATTSPSEPPPIARSQSAPTLSSVVSEKLPGAIELTATPATRPPARINAASMTPKETQYTLEREVRWQGKNYILKLDFPCETTKGEEIEATAREYADYFVQDLIANLGKQKGIKPGENCEILFDETGYTIYSTPKGFDAASAGAFEKIAPEKKFEAREQQSQALSTILKSPPTEGKTYAQTVHEKLSSSEHLGTLRSTVRSSRNEQSKTLAPVNLVHHRHSCYLNTAFQQLVNDERLVDELSDPNNFKDGTNNKLYQAIQSYRNAQVEGKKKVDISDTLGITSEQQMDVKDAWAALSRHLMDGDHAPPRLASIFSERTVHVPNEGANLSDLASSLFEETDKLPEVISIQTDRIKVGELPTGLSAKIEEGVKKVIHKTLLELEDQQMPEELSASLYVDSSEDGHIENELAIIDRILEDEKLLQQALKILPKNLKAPIHKCRIREIRKNEKPVQVDDGKVIIKGQPYKITSFAVHTGDAEGGHYVAFIKKGNQHYKIDDISKVTGIGVTEFDAAAQTAAFYTLHKEDVATASPTTSITAPAPKARNQIIAIDGKEITTITGTSVEFSSEEGEMNLVETGFTLVNPTNKDLKLPHPQLQGMLARNLQHGIEKAEKARKDQTSWLGGVFNRGSYSPRGKVTGPDMLLVHHVDTNPANSFPIIHLPVKGPLTKEEIKQAVKDALAFDQKNGNAKLKLAFPIFKATTDAPDREIASWMREAITEYCQTTDGVRQGHIKIIYPKAP